MKKLSILFISFLTVISAFLTSCDEDHYGPAPVDVTANYSNKISNPNPNLVLTYNGDAMNGKSVDFSTVTGETAIITLYDILPGEKALKLTHIPLTGDAEGYSFQGKGIGTTTQSTFNYEGREVKGRLILNLADVTMANANLWAKNYRFADVEHGTGKVIADEGNGYQWEEKDDKMTSCAIYFRFPETEEATEATDTCALLEELLLAEMDDISFYRALLFAMTEADLRNAFFEILTDKQNHTVALSHLYAKYFG